MPEQLSRVRIDGEEITFRVSGKCQTRRCREHACRGRTDVLEFPFTFSGRRIDRAQCAPRAVIRSGGTLTGAARVALTWNVFLLPRVKRRTYLSCVHEKQMLCWIVGAGPEIGRARRIGTGQRTFLIRHVPGEGHRASVSADLLGPGGDDIWFSDNQLSSGAIERVEESIAIGEHH